MADVGRRGFLGRVVAALGVGSAAEAAPAGDVAAREVTYAPVREGPLAVIRVDDATMAKIEAGPTGPVANGFGARYFDGGAPEPVVVPESARAARARLSAVTVDGRARAWGVAGPPGLIGDGGRRGRRAT
jgi:hypothetical protein